MEKVVATSLQPVIGVKEVLLRLNDVPKAVVSNSNLYQIKDVLKITNMGQFFNQLFSSEQVLNPKPSPDIYLYAASQLVVNPKDCLVIEDSISGATAALSAGMEVIGFLAGKLAYYPKKCV